MGIELGGRRSPVLLPCPGDSAGLSAAVLYSGWLGGPGSRFCGRHPLSPHLLEESRNPGVVLVAGVAGRGEAAGSAAAATAGKAAARGA